MRNAAKPAIMSMIMGAVVDNNSKNQQKEREQQDAMDKLREQVAKIRQDAMDNIHSQAPMQKQMREKMVEASYATPSYLQHIFMPRQKDRTIEEFHSGAFVRDQMKAKPVSLPGTEAAHLQLQPEKAESDSSK